jgi:hypothetical protein
VGRDHQVVQTRHGRSFGFSGSAFRLKPERKKTESESILISRLSQLNIALRRRRPPSRPCSPRTAWQRSAAGTSTQPQKKR